MRLSRRLLMATASSTIAPITTSCQKTSTPAITSALVIIDSRIAPSTVP